MGRDMVLVACILAACSPARENARLTAVTTSTPLSLEALDEAELGRLVGQLAMLATGRPLARPRAMDVVARLRRGSLSLPAYLDTLLRSREFSETLFTVMLNPGPWVDVPARLLGPVLKQKAIGRGSAARLFFLDDPCSVNEAIRVDPWWGGESVLVCPDSYRPDEYIFDRALGIACDSPRAFHLATKEERGRCGCGPHLMRCFRDDDHLEQIRQSLVDENLATFAHVVDSDLPFQSVFTMNETVRDRNAELVYLRFRVEAGAPAAELTRFLASPSWHHAGQPTARREMRPDQFAGLLTTASTAFGASLRERMMLYESTLWCTSVRSVDVKAEDIFSAAGPSGDIREGIAGWELLARRPICTNCHARMDHGMQFFLGFSDFRVRQHYDPREQSTALGKVFVDDIADLRGQAALSPRGFARLAVEQPEFPSCVAEKVGRYLFSHELGSADRRLLEGSFRRRGSLRDLFETGLERLVARTLELELESERTVPTHLRSLVEAHCLGCHGDRAPLNLGGERLSRPTLYRMLEQVGFRTMPKGASLTEADRRSFVEGLTGLLWEDPARRAAARDFFLSWMRALPIHRATTTASLLGSRVSGQEAASGADATWLWPSDWFNDTQAPDLFQFTPVFSTTLLLDALKACRAKGLTDDELDRCLDVATSPDGFIRHPF